MIWHQPYVSRSSVASTSYSSEGIVNENKNITNEKEGKIAEMRAIQDPSRLMEAFVEQVASVDEVGYHVFRYSDTILLATTLLAVTSPSRVPICRPLSFHPPRRQQYNTRDMP